MGGRSGLVPGYVAIFITYLTAKGDNKISETINKKMYLYLIRKLKKYRPVNRMISPRLIKQKIVKARSISIKSLSKCPKSEVVKRDKKKKTITST